MLIPDNIRKKTPDTTIHYLRVQRYIFDMVNNTDLIKVFY